LSKLSWIIFSVITVGILAGLVIFSKSTGLDVSNIDINTIQTANSQDGKIADHVFGKVGSKVTLVEYGDFQCPPCGSVYPIVKVISEQYKNQLQFVFRNFPIMTIHPNAKAAAAAAESAGLQGKYWEMHNKLYEGQNDWSNLNENDRTTYFVNLAKSLSLDINRFESDMVSDTVLAKINYDLALGKKANVQGTPTFYLNGKLLDANVYGTDAKFKEAINAELKKAGIALPI
jgi:protein-disulfide isomerase